MSVDPSSIELPKLPERSEASHKGNYGHALLIGGSRGMAGSIVLAGMAAIRSGAGLTTLAVPDRIVETVAGFCPNYMTFPIPCDDRGQIVRQALEPLEEKLEQVTAVALGPGLGRSNEINEFVNQLVLTCAKPMVIDADALRAMAGLLQSVECQFPAPRILTPHPGEFEAISDCPAKNRDVQVQAALRLAERCDLTIVLKGHRTLVTDGRRTDYNQTGNPGMATGGSGDCLTGIIAALLCQKMKAWDAARLGAHLHGLAGDFALARLGGHVVAPTDLIESLPDAFQEILERSRIA